MGDEGWTTDDGKKKKGKKNKKAKKPKKSKEKKPSKSKEKKEKKPKKTKVKDGSPKPKKQKEKKPKKEKVSEEPCDEIDPKEMENLMAIAEQKRRDDKTKRAKTQNIIGHAQLERMRASLAGFKTDAKTGKARVPRELLIGNWERKMEPRLLSRLVFSLFGKNKREMPFKSYVELYWNLVEAKNQIRALTIIMISNCLSDDDHPQETCYTNLVEYVTDIIGSYMHLLLFYNLPEMNQWLQLGYTNYTGDNRQVAKCLLSTCEVHDNIVGAGHVESWLYRCKLFNIINRQLFQGIYNLFKVSPGRTLLPTPCTSFENSIYMALSYILLLNSLTTSHTDKWTLLFNSNHAPGGYSQLQAALKDMAPTFIFVQDEQGYIFGGHASKPWDMASGWYGNEDSFLFNLRPDVYLYFASEDNDNIQLMSSYGIAMGGEGDCYGLFVDHSLRIGRTARVCETFLNYWPLSEFSVFQIRKLEVWGVIDVTETPVFEESSYIKSRDPAQISSSFSMVQATGYQTGDLSGREQEMSPPPTMPILHLLEEE